MHCKNCVAKLAAVLDHTPGIHHWNADLSVQHKPVTVHGDVTEQELVALIQQAGFDVNGNTAVNCDMNSATMTAPVKQSFWSDKKLWKRASFNTLSCLLELNLNKTEDLENMSS